MENQKDPVCGMNVDPKTTKFKTEYKDKTYYFCSEQCKKNFEEKPENFISKQ